MRRLILPLCATIILSGCQQQVSVPTAQELINNQSLLTAWQARCNTGEYSHLTPTAKSEFCATTQEATISVAEKKAGDNASDFYDANTKRK